MCSEDQLLGLVMSYANTVIGVICSNCPAESVDAKRYFSASSRSMFFMTWGNNLASSTMLASSPLSATVSCGPIIGSY